ncbi:hypothetical protein VTL71DRAFT_5555 [Oculimacula yallundae]|uniref:Uncharacterized protein n=1 Tax=Oculimacula yallundae TaxID=86028 RepID=A0ABR4C1G1_9HELO
MDAELSITGYLVLSSLVFPVLKSINSTLEIRNNPLLNTIVLPEIQMITNTTSLEGTFSRIDMPKLKQASLGFQVNSTNTSFDCSEFDRFRSLGFIKGNYKSTNPPDKQSTSLSGGAKAGIGIVATVLAIIFALCTWWFCFKKESSSKNQEDVDPIDAIAELPQGGHHETTEVPGISKPGELHAHSVGENFQ